MLSIGFFILCALLLGGRFFYMRRKAQKATPAEKAAEEAKESRTRRHFHRLGIPALTFAYRAHRKLEVFRGADQGQATVPGHQRCSPGLNSLSVSTRRLTQIISPSPVLKRFLLDVRQTHADPRAPLRDRDGGVVEKSAVQPGMLLP